MGVLEQPDDGPDGVLAAEVVVEPQVVDAALTQLVQDSQTGGGRPRDETGTAARKRLTSSMSTVEEVIVTVPTKQRRCWLELMLCSRGYTSNPGASWLVIPHGRAPDVRCCHS